MRVIPILLSTLIGVLVATLATICIGVMILGVSMIMIMPGADYKFEVFALATATFFIAIFVIVFREMYGVFIDRGW